MSEPISASALPSAGWGAPAPADPTSAQRIVALPAIDSATAMTRTRGMDSRSTSAEKSAIQIGLVVTRATLLATLVYSSEEIQVAKCSARNAPAALAKRQSPRVRARSSAPLLARAKGRRISAAMERRQAAIAGDGTPCPCARRTRIDEVATTATPPAMTA